VKDPIRLFVGYDPREAAAYHVFCQSVIEHTSMPVAFMPLSISMLGDYGCESDGSNAFTLSRYLVPFLCDFVGWAIYADGDMLCQRDLAHLWAQRLNGTLTRAVSVVQHDYHTTHRRKYVGSSMESVNNDYPRKNWSSLMLWNCSHFGNRGMTPEWVRSCAPAFLHRFQWLAPHHVGALPPEWNHLVGEYAPQEAAVYHYTLGVPGLTHYADCEGAEPWHRTLLNALGCAGEKASHLTLRAESRCEIR